MKKEQKVIVVCGIKNSGKTTLLEKLVKRLSEKNIKTAVIKHDSHDFECDISGTDSYKLKQAGAYGTAVYSDYRFFIHKEETQYHAEDLIQVFPEADIIFIEGLKNSNYPKIEVIRKEISNQIVSNPKNRFLIVTDIENDRFTEKTLGFENIEDILECIEEEMWKF